MRYVTKTDIRRYEADLAPSGGHTVVPSTRNSIGRQTILYWCGHVVRWLHLCGDVHEETPFPWRLRNR